MERTIPFVLDDIQAKSCYENFFLRHFFHFYPIGPYQPSHAVMLKFYGYYKQASKGKCSQPKPSFWDVVGRAKWEAWNKCGNMTQKEAMTQYIDELKQVIQKLLSI